MSVLVRRFIIIALVFTNFAILFAALVVQPSQRNLGMLSGRSTGCTPQSFQCGLAL